MTPEEKNQILNQIRDLSAKGEITREEVLSAFKQGQVQEQDEDPDLQKQKRLSAIMYFIGGAVIFTGIAILIGQQWRNFSDFTRILATLGVAIAAYAVGILFDKDERLKLISQSFFFLSGLIFPIGLHVSFDILHFAVNSRETQLMISGILLSIFLGGYLTFRNTVLLIFTIIFGSWVYLSLTENIYRINPVWVGWKFDCYRLMALSLSYMLMGYYFGEQTQKRKTLSEWLMSIGILIFLGVTLGLGGWKPEQSLFWELSYPLVVFIFIYLSVQLKNKSFLSISSLYLMAYISKITAEYFANNLGWAFSLVMIGFLLIGIGYLAFYLNKKYIR